MLIFMVVFSKKKELALQHVLNKLWLFKDTSFEKKNEGTQFKKLSSLNTKHNCRHFKM